jgi:hypothetical protein
LIRSRKYAVTGLASKNLPRLASRRALIADGAWVTPWLPLLAPVGAVLLEDVADYESDAYCLWATAIGRSSPTTRSIRESVCAATSRENSNGWPTLARMHRHIGIPTRSPTTTQTTSTTAAQANMLISCFQRSVTIALKRLRHLRIARLVPPQALGPMASKGGNQ